MIFYFLQKLKETSKLSQLLRDKLSQLLRDKFSSLVSKWDNEIITNILEWKCGQLADHLPTKNLTKFALRDV